MSKSSLKELSLLFLKLGTIAFGGPAAHIAMMQEEIVRKRKWLTEEKFLDLLGATNLIPGPNSTELAIHIGYRQAGWLGLLLAGLCFILPAAIIVTIIAKFYINYGDLPEFTGIMYGIKPVIIAIILKALWNLGRSALKTMWLALLAASVVTLNILGLNELIVLFGAGLIMILKELFSQKRNFGFLPLYLISQSAIPNNETTTYVDLCPLFLVFLKIGSVLFGSGYVLLAFLQADLVEKFGWLTQQQLFDAITVGQVTPGPVFTTATFIGYILSGWKGAIVTTIGIFLPSFIFVAATGPFIPKLRQSKILSAFLDGVNAAAVALMIVVTIKLIGHAFIDIPTIILGYISTYLLFFTPVNSIWLVLSGAIIGYLING